MKDQKRNRKFALAVRLFGVTLTTCLLAFAQDGSQAQGVKNIVLVHGAWANGSCWNKVIPLLVSKGFHVTAVENPLMSLADDVATTERALALQTGPVLLVGHSYGGAVISEAGNQANVAGLVFVAAYAPDDNESVLSLAKEYPAPIASELQADPSQSFFTVSEQGIFQDFAQDLPRVEKLNLFVTQGPTGAAALGAPITGPAWKGKPNWFIVASQDRAISPDLEALEASRMGATTITLNTSHVAMLADPVHVAEFIASAANHLSGQ